MKAIIMAGGEGTRLRPLTCDCPKPMMRLMDRPVMDYSLELLALHGVTEAAITLGYLPERIRDWFGDESHGISLRYYTEYHPLGTAGGVKQAKDFLTETFCVLSGDGVTDCDLTAALEFHRKSGAKATMVLKHIPDPTEYGLVITDTNGRILRFTEKPAWGEVVSDTVNTGIYILEPEILELIPDGEYDFGSQLFPRLASEGMLHGWVMDGYWCDIGDIPAYLGTCRDALDGSIHLPSLEGFGCRIHPEAHISKDAHIEPPCYIGSGAVIAPGVTVGAHSVIGQNVRIGECSSIKRSIIWQDSVLKESVQLRGCILGKGVSLAPCVRIYENCALGSSVRIGVDSEIAPGVCVWPGKMISEATLIDHNLVWGGSASSCFVNGTLPVRYPDDALRSAQAYAAVLNPMEVLLGRSPSPTAAAIWHSCASGLIAQGVTVVDAGVCTEPQLRYTMGLMRIGYAIYADDSVIIPLCSGGIRISRQQQRKLCALISRQDYPCPFAAEPQPVVYSGSSAKAYTAMLADTFCGDPILASAAAVYCENPLVLDQAEKAFERAGLTARFEWEDELMELFPGEIGIWLSADGRSARFSHPGGMLTDPQNELLTAWAALEHGEKELVTASHFTRAIWDIAQRFNAHIVSTCQSRAEFEQTLEAHPYQLSLSTDGIFLAMSVLSALTVNALTLTGWLSTMPRVHRIEKRFHLDNDKRGSMLRKFTEGSAHPGELSFDRNNAHAWISPMDDTPECSIIAEAYDMEAARELCDFCESELKKIAEND